MLPFNVQPQPGRPISEQVIFAVKKALALGALKPGDSFPSVRTISRELRINPNTAQKVLMQLNNAGIVEIEPGIGAKVAARPAVSEADRAALLARPLDHLCVEARCLGLTLPELEAQLRERWHQLENDSIS